MVPSLAPVCPVRLGIGLLRKLGHLFAAPLTCEAVVLRKKLGGQSSALQHVPAFASPFLQN